MSQSDIHEVEVSLEQADLQIAMSDAVARLEQNRDFQEIVLGHYFRDEAVRLVHMKGDPQMQREDRQANLLTAMDAIPAFRHFLERITDAGAQARVAKEDYHSTLDELRGEER